MRAWVDVRLLPAQVQSRPALTLLCLPADLQRVLLGLMSKCSGRIELPALVQGILAAISAAPRVSRCTLAIADDEHETLTSWTSAPS